MKSKSKRVKQHSISRKQIDANALKCLENTCDTLVGTGIFKLFDSLDIAVLLKMRFAAVKMIISSTKFITAKEQVEYKSLFINLLSKGSIETPIGKTIPLSIYLREGLTLIRYVEGKAQNKLRCSAELVHAFAPWVDRGAFHINSICQVMHYLQRFTIILSNWSSELFLMNIDQLAIFAVASEDNSVVCRRQKLECENLMIDGSFRKVIAIGWPDHDGEIKSLYLTPEQLIIQSGHPTKIQVYIQVHALKRLEERLGLVPGIVHKAIFDAFSVQRPEFHWQVESILLPLIVNACKVGYLVCSLVGDKLLIRTFLFLTNDGTPEGQKFNELTKLARLDKAHLKIDSLEGFLSLDIAGNSILNDVFVKSGCDSLLDLSLLRPFYRDQISLRECNYLLGYMMGIDKRFSAERIQPAINSN
jgi:hypothetical protein